MKDPGLLFVSRPGDADMRAEIAKAVGRGLECIAQSGSKRQASCELEGVLRIQAQPPLSNGNHRGAGSELVCGGVASWQVQ